VGVWVGASVFCESQTPASAAGGKVNMRACAVGDRSLLLQLETVKCRRLAVKLCPTI